MVVASRDPLESMTLSSGQAHFGQRILATEYRKMCPQISITQNVVVSSDQKHSVCQQSQDFDLAMLLPGNEPSHISQAESHRFPPSDRIIQVFLLATAREISNLGPKGIEKE